MTRQQFEVFLDREYKTLVKLANKQLARTPAIQHVSGQDIVQDVVLAMLESPCEGRKARYEEFQEQWAFHYCKQAVEWKIGMLVRHGVEVLNPSHEAIEATRAEAEPSAASELELRQLLDRELDKILNIKLRMAAELVIKEGWDYEGASEQVGIPIGSIKSCLYRLRERLREEMEK